MIINLNARCTVVLTEAGAKVWNRACSGIPAAHRPTTTKVSGDTIRIPVWEVLEVFGPQTGIGMGAPLFADNNLDIEVAEPHNALRSKVTSTATALMDTLAVMDITGGVPDALASQAAALQRALENEGLL